MSKCGNSAELRVLLLIGGRHLRVPAVRWNLPAETRRFLGRPVTTKIHDKASRAPATRVPTSSAHCGCGKMSSAPLQMLTGKQTLLPEGDGEQCADCTRENWNGSGETSADKGNRLCLFRNFAQLHEIMPIHTWAVLRTVTTNPNL